MNQIETEWLRLKADELAGQMFEDEYDRRLAVIEGIEARVQLAGCRTQRYRFNSNSI
jgi:putative transposase